MTKETRDEMLGRLWRKSAGDFAAMTDTHDKDVEIKIVPDPKSGHRVWIHVGGHLKLRIYRAQLHLEGVALIEPDRPL